MIGDEKIDNSMLLQWVIQKQDMGLWTTLVWIRIWINGEVFGQLSGY